MVGISILLVHSLKLFRESLKSVLEGESDLSVTGQACGAGDLVRVAGELNPDVILVEAGMPGPSPIEATRQILRLRPSTNVIFLCPFDDEELVYECMHAGAAGFLSRDTGAAEMIGAIRQIARGGKYLAAPSLSRFMDRWRVRKSEGGDPAAILTAREREVLKLLAEGNSVKECAALLNLSAKTIDAHKFNLMRKLGIHNKAQLVHYAFQKKIVRLPVAS